jgi:hypothetical protein
LLSVQIIRDASVAALAPARPATAARIWAGHPAVEISLGLAEIGEASRERRSIDPRIFGMIGDAASKAPLSPEPFLVRGVAAETAGDLTGAKQAFLAAQWRDPRSLPAAYFLANYYLRRNDALAGLEQIALLARLSPGGGGSVAPFIAVYAADRTNWPAIRALFRSQNSIEEAVLTELSKDPRNTDAIFALADPQHRNVHSGWLSPLLSGLLASGDYIRAREIWMSVGGGRPDAGTLIYDSGFSEPEASPPFNWQLVSSTVGLAERQPGGRLHVIFYGNDDGVLASQLLLMPAGTYRLQMALTGAPVRPELLRWSVRCDKSSKPIATVGIDQAGRRGWRFEVPSGCPAQWLELSGRSGDIAQQSEVTITGLGLERTGLNG